MTVRYSFILLMLYFMCPKNPVQGQSRIFVHAAASGLQSGQNWADAYTDLQDALQTSVAGDTIWVAQGIYKPTVTADREVSFLLPRGVVLLGGFQGAETAAAQRNPALYPAILSGDIGVPADTSDNSRHILRILECDSVSTIDGITFRDGNSGNESGSALLISNALPGGPAPVKIMHCLFTSNTSGAVFVAANTPQTGLTGNTFPQFIACHFRENEGQVLISQRSALFRDCRFIKNRGRACYVGYLQGSNISASFYNCIFAENQFNSAGVAIQVYRGTAKVYNSLFYENKNASVYPNLSTIDLYNCILWNSNAHQDVDINFPSMEHGNLYHCLLKYYDTNYPVGVLQNCIYGTQNTAYSGLQGCCQGCQTGTGGATVPGDGYDPLFLDAPNEDYRLDDCSAAIDAGNNDYLAGLEQDISGGNRIRHGRVDLGPLEFDKPQRDCRIFVTDTCNACPGSFRRALAMAKSHPGPDTVHFALSGPAPYIFHPLNSTQGCLIAEGDSTVIDATTQPGYEPGMLQLDGSHLVWPANGAVLCSAYEGYGLRLLGNYMELHGITVQNWRNSKAGLRMEGDHIRIGMPGKGNLFINTQVQCEGNYSTFESNVFVGNQSNSLPYILLKNIVDIRIGGAIGSGKENRFTHYGIVFTGENYLSDTSYIAGNTFEQNATQQEARILFSKDQFGHFTHANGFRIGGSSETGNQFLGGILNGVYSDSLFANGGRYNGMVITHNTYRCVKNPEFYNSSDPAFISPAALLAIEQATPTSVTGLATPGDSIQVYRVDDADCAGTRCQGGTFLGNTVADNSGHWVLEHPSQYLYPGQHVTALSFRTGSNAHTSIFADCRNIVCETAIQDIQQTLCAGDTVFFQGIPLTESGVYDTLLVAVNGCDSLVRLTLTIDPALELTATVTPDNGSSNGSISAHIGGGTPPYLFYWDSNDSGAELNGLTAGTYALTVTDSNGCNLSGIFDVELITSIPTPAPELSLQIHPNPFTRSIEVNAIHCSDSLTLKIYNAFGQTMYSDAFRHTITIDGSNYAPGIYWAIAWQNGHKILARRLIKLR